MKLKKKPKHLYVMQPNIVHSQTYKTIQCNVQYTRIEKYVASCKYCTYVAEVST